MPAHRSSRISAAAALGAWLDLPVFHGVVLGAGAVTLPVVRDRAVRGRICGTSLGYDLPLKHYAAGSRLYRGRLFRRIEELVERLASSCHTNKRSKEYQMRHLLLTTAILIGIWPHSARAQSCPTQIPVPATASDVACYTVNKPVAMKCATSISPVTCSNFNNLALNNALLTMDGYNFLMNIGFCAIVADIGLGPQIFDFCPMGCFAADAQIASTVRSDGRADYVAAASVTPGSSLMSMADEASLGDVVLAPRSVKRIVRGPEGEELSVFALANGRTLRVTSHHPMVLDSGKIIEASQVASGMSFVGLDGRSVKVTAITREKPVADVFNFVTGGDTQLGHIIVAEGVLVGDLQIQNELANEESSIGLRR